MNVRVIVFSQFEAATSLTAEITLTKIDPNRTCTGRI